MTTEQRYEVLDGLRGVAAISVMLMHQSQHSSPEFLKNAYISVDLFFMLSGFVLAHSYKSKLSRGLSAGEYMKRRFIRLYPIFVVSMAIGIPVLFAVTALGLSDYSMRSIVVASISNLFFIPYLGHSGIANMASAVSQAPLDMTVGEIFPANPPAWSLFFEMVASVALLFLIRLRRAMLVRIIVVSAAMLTATGVLINFEKHFNEIDFGQGWGTFNFLGGLIRVAYGFTVGILIHSLRESGWKWGYDGVLKNIIRNDISLYISFIVIVAVPYKIRGIYPLFIIFGLAPIIVYHGATLVSSGPLYAKLSKFLGWLSYPLYCLHFPVSRLVALTIPNSERNFALAITLSSAISIGIAVVAEKFIGTPVRACLLRKFILDKMENIVTEPVISVANP